MILKDLDSDTVLIKFSKLIGAFAFDSSADESSEYSSFGQLFALVPGHQYSLVFFNPL